MRFLAVAVAGFLLPWPAFASLVTIHFEGVVVPTDFPPPLNQTYDNLPVDEFGILPPIASGDRFSGALTFDDTVPAATSGPAGTIYYYGDYYYGVRVARVELEINGANFAHEVLPYEQNGGTRVTIVNTPEKDSYAFDLNFGIGSFEFLASSYLSPAPDSASFDFVSGSQLTDIPDFSRARTVQILYLARVETEVLFPRPRNKTSGFMGSITSTSSSVPEPSSIAALAAAALLGAIRRSRT